MRRLRNAAIGLAIVRRQGPRALLTGAPVRWARESVERRHVSGALMFGIGWGITNVCPAPVVTQVGQGIGWSLVTLTGILIGVAAHMGRERAETEPAADEQVEPSIEPRFTRPEAPAAV